MLWCNRILIRYSNWPDLYDEIFEIIDSCTFSAKTVSEPMWNVLGLIYKAFKTTAMDFMDGKERVWLGTSVP